MTSPILEGRSLCKSYDEGRIEALRGVDISIAAGEYIAITGPSGSGKSTLLHLLGGLDNPTSGTVLFRNARLDADVDLDTYRSGSVGFIFQAFHLMPTLRSIENVQVPMLAPQREGSRRTSRGIAQGNGPGAAHEAVSQPALGGRAAAGGDCAGAG